MSKWIKKDDKVLVIAGNERGRSGKVLSRDEDRVVVQGLNIRKKHVKRKSKVPTPEIMEMEMPMHISNVRICSDADKPLRLKVRIKDDGKKELVYKEGKKEVVFREIRGAKAK
jgi:large subunit ribosomal protein L24